MEEFIRLKANKIWNRKTFKKLFKFGNLRIYITWNLRLKARNKRDDIFGCLKTPRLRRKLWERAQGKCEKCAKDNPWFYFYDELEELKACSYDTRR